MRCWPLTLFVSVIVLDLGTKALAVNWTEVKLNQGLAFGWLGGGESNFFPGLIGLLAGLITLALLSQAASTKQRLAQALFLGGIWANLIDRAISGGAVRDWLKVPVLGLYNNLADWSIFIGVILWIILLFLRTKTSSSSTSQQA